MAGNTTTEPFRRAWCKHYPRWYTNLDNALLSAEALNSCGFLSAIACHSWDGQAQDAPLVIGGRPATVEGLGRLSRWGNRMKGILDELVSVGFLVEDKGAYKVRNFKRWQDRPSGGARKGAGRQKTEDRRQKKGSKRLEDDHTARVWERLTKLRKELIPGARSSSMSPNARKAIRKRIEDHGIEDALAVIEHRAGEVRRDPSAAQWFQWATIFAAKNFERTLGMIGTRPASSSTLDVRREDYASEGGEWDFERGEVAS